MHPRVSSTVRRFVIFNILLLGPAAFLLLLFPGAAQTPTGDAPKQPAEVKATAESLQQAYDRAFQLSAKVKGRVYRTKVTPKWLPGNTRFWYRNDLRGGAKEFILVDAAKGTRLPAFDHQHLAAALSKATGTTYQADRLPFDAIDFVDGDQAVQFKIGAKTWKCTITYAVAPVESKTDPKKDIPPPKKDAPEEDEEDLEDAWDFTDVLERPAQPFQPKKGGPQKRDPLAKVKSPDGKWTALGKDGNAYLLDAEGKEHRLTEDGTTGKFYGYFTWSRDGKTLIAYRTQPAETPKVPVLDSSKKEVARPKLIELTYRLPGDKLDVHEFYLFDVAAKKAIKADTPPIDFGGVPQLRWAKDGQHVLFQRTERGHTCTRLIEVNLATGKTRDVIDETCSTRVVRAKAYQHYVNDGEQEILWASERDGWNHLYLIDGPTGKVKQQITKGHWAVRKVERVDDKARQIWFSASGYFADQDPHQLQFFRVNYDGTGLTVLTPGNGQHAITYSPDQKYLIDVYSRPDLGTVTELRRAADGGLVCVVEKADTADLDAVGWRWPEVFQAKGRDNKTDIWGVVYRPTNFDPAKKYPVIEHIYAGPWTASAPKVFSPYNAMQGLAELGFVVVQIDGMGLPTRSRAFHDVSHMTHADAGLPDRILWIKALGQRYPYLDLTRVGIYGHSGGGYSSTRALLDHPDFYKVAVSSSGNHVPGGYNLGYTEQWMGAMGAHYAASSNATDSHKLKGKLFLLHGESDTNVVCSLTTMKVVDALVKAGKDFDLLIIPGANHALGGGYVMRRRYDFFVRHLLGVEPPDRNRTAFVPAVEEK